MNVYIFTLIVTGVDEDRLDALYEAGCDDATVGLSAQQSEIGFDREAPSLPQAILTAIAQAEDAGATLARVEPDPLVWASAIAERLGRTRQSVDMLVKAQRGPGVEKLLDQRMDGKGDQWFRGRRWQVPPHTRSARPARMD